MRRFVWTKILKNEEAVARVGPQRHRKQKIILKLNPKFIIYNHDL